MRAAGMLLFIAGACSAQVQNAADAGAGVYTTSLAPGSQAVINFSGTTGPGPASATVSLLPVNSTTPVSAQVVKVQGFVIEFVVPDNMPLGPAQLIYKPGSQATQWTSVTIVPDSFSLYRSGPGGSLIAQNVPTSGPAFPNGLSTPAQPGQGVQIWGSGFGATPQSNVQITLGGVAQQVLYVGTPSYTPGLTQINFLVAPGTPDGCYVPLTLTYGTQSVSGFISKTSDGLPCRHPWGLSTAALQMLDNGELIQTGEIQLATGLEAASASLASRTESAQFLLNDLNAAQIASYFAPAAVSAQPCSIVSSYGEAFSILGGGPSGTFGAMTISNAASSLTLPWTNPTPPDSPLSALPPAVLAGGNWTWNASGASGFSPSSFGFTLPPAIQLAGGAPIQINRSLGQTVSWNGSDYDSNATLQLSLTAPGFAVLSCTAPAQSGKLTIPASLLSQFSAGSTGSLTVSVAESGAGIPSADFIYESDPLLMLVLWNSTDARPVDFQ